MKLIITVLEILPIKTFGKNNTQKITFIGEYGDGDKSKKVAFTSYGQSVSKVQELKTSDLVEVEFAVESREYNSNWFTDAVAFRFNVNKPNSATNSAIQHPPTQIKEDGSDLPF